MESRRMPKVRRTLLLGSLAWAGAFAISLRSGAIADASPEIVAQLRMPRALLASAVGIGLSVGGAALQALFANPLCEPYTLGISSGAALGAAIGATLGLEWAFAGIAGSAFAGALLFAGVLYALAMRRGSGNLTVLLAGVMLGFLGSSLVALWMVMADTNGIQSAMQWLLGDLSRARPSGAIIALTGSLALTGLLWFRSRDLDALLMGEEDALALGVDVRRVRRRVIVLSSLLIGLTVSAAGMIGFVGLLVPHFARRLVGSMHGALLPACVVLGAATMTLADALARVVARPYELPVGVVTALLGAPVFLWIMLGRRESA